jgi:hypothetical protein
MGKNQTHYLNYNGATFVLTIESAQSNIVYHDFYITLVYPNGTSDYKHVSTTRISAGNYRTTIQPVFTQLAGGYNAYMTVDLELGLSPVTTGMGASPVGYDASTSIPFTRASGTYGASTTTHVYEISEDEWQKSIVNYNPIGNVPSLANEILAWMWSGALAFLNAIPVIGPLAVTLLGYAGGIASGLLFWLGFIYNNWPAILLTVEALILMAVVMTGGSLEKCCKNYVLYHVAFIKGISWVANQVKEWILRFVEVIANIVAALH